MRIISAEFVRAAKEPSHYPPALLPEVAFAGRSNVGKSSLINSLLGRKGLARTSNTPGRTREINFFVINGSFSFVDLPGYGYAKVPLEVRRSWGPMVETYLRERPNLRLVVLLFDIRRDPSDQDRQLIEWLGHYQRPFTAVLTKCDKLSGNECRNRYRFLAGGALASVPAPVMFSSRTGEGKDLLWRRIAEAVSDRSEPGS